MMMPFGKFKGAPLSAVPTDYLLWLDNSCELMPRLASAVKAELERREIDQSIPKLPDLRPLANEWRRRLAFEFHLDRGGTKEAMQAINRGYELLVGMVEASSS